MATAFCQLFKILYRYIYVYSIVIILLLPTACGKLKGNPENQKELKDKIKTCKKDSCRLVSLNSSITEILFFLELDKQISGISAWSNRPAQKVKNIKRTGSEVWPNMEMIISLDPDYVFLLKDHNTDYLIYQLQDIYREKVIVLGIKKIDDLIKTLKDLHSFFKLDVSVMNKIKSFEKNTGKMIEDIKKQFRGKRVYIDFSPDKPPFYSMGRGSILQSIMEKTGAVVPESVRIFPRYNLNYILNFNPDIIIAPIYMKESFEDNEEKIFWQSFYSSEKKRIKKFWGKYLENKEYYYLNSALINQASPSVEKGLMEIKNALKPGKVY